MPEETEVRKTTSADTPDSKMERIRRRAYELYLARGRGSGNELDDWLAAEEEIKREEQELHEWKLNH